MQKMNSNFRKAKAIEQKNKERLLKANPELNEDSGIYFLTRTDELGIRHAYVGLARHVLTRLAQHLSNYQYIDNSIRKHGLYSEENPYGYKVNFLNCLENELEEKERYYITQYSLNGYQMKNRDTGGGAGKKEIGDRKQPKTYREGIEAGKKSLARELSSIAEKHLKIEIRDDKKNNKISQRQFEKFKELLSEEK